MEEKCPLHDVVFQEIKDDLKRLDERMERIEAALLGNGKPGLTTRVTVQENTTERLSAEWEGFKRGLIGTAVTLGLGVLGFVWAVASGSIHIMK